MTSKRKARQTRKRWRGIVCLWKGVHRWSKWRAVPKGYTRWCIRCPVVQRNPAMTVPAGPGEFYAAGIPGSAL